MKPREYSFDTVGAVGQHLRQTLVDLFCGLAQRAVGLAGIEARQIGRHPRRRAGAIDMSLSLRMTISREFIAPALFMGLIGHARRHRTVADHGDDIVLEPREGRAPTAMPSAAEIEVEEWAAPNGS